MIVAEGAVLAGGRYELISLIAVGGMGEVWRGHDVWAGRPVAVKVLRQEFTGDVSSLHRLRIEAHNAAMLSHPNIAKVFDYREEDGTGYLVLEHVPGESLADVLAARVTIPALRLIPILRQAAQGLFAAHQAGVIHRDVKPGNILLTPTDQVKLTDFGISVSLGQAALTATGKVMGTAQYLAPEQALGRPATPAGDMYALGIIAFESLAGARPFTEGGDVDIALAQVRQAPPPLPSWVEPELGDLVFRLLDKDPANRPANCAELAHMLDRLASGAALPSRPDTARSDIADDAGAPPPVRAAPAARGSSAATQAQPLARPAAAPAVEPAGGGDLGGAGLGVGGIGVGSAGGGGAGPAGALGDGPSAALDNTSAGDVDAVAAVILAEAAAHAAARTAPAAPAGRPGPAQSPGTAVPPARPVPPPLQVLPVPRERPAPPTTAPRATAPRATAPRAPGTRPPGQRQSRLRAVFPFLFLLLCLAAIVAGIILSAGPETFEQGFGSNNPDTTGAIGAESGVERGIIRGEPLASVPSP